nr:hypothetical protein BDOA9_0206460 [Bradyrhizobium sp. DOA9]
MPYRAGPLVLPSPHIEFSGLRWAPSVRAVDVSAPCPNLARHVLMGRRSATIERPKAHKQAGSNRTRNRSPAMDQQGGASTMCPRRPPMARARSDLIDPTMVPQVGTQARCVREGSLTTT